MGDICVCEAKLHIFARLANYLLDYFSEREKRSLPPLRESSGSD
ncbi:hypothetical protein HMPREF9999_00920 [Alloprevotella sp. oral taxon 473 str. F0040]|nr:hypothetical protein HMPREF9999_00920 [Alloprevotella sp. oral taxon 473 str. F0040]